MMLNAAGEEVENKDPNCGLFIRSRQVRVFFFASVNIVLQVSRPSSCGDKTHVLVFPSESFPISRVEHSVRMFFARETDEAWFHEHVEHGNARLASHEMGLVAGMMKNLLRSVLR